MVVVELVEGEMRREKEGEEARKGRLRGDEGEIERERERGRGRRTIDQKRHGKER